LYISNTFHNCDQAQDDSRARVFYVFGFDCCLRFVFFSRHCYNIYFIHFIFFIVILYYIYIAYSTPSLFFNANANANALKSPPLASGVYFWDVPPVFHMYPVCISPPYPCPWSLVSCVCLYRFYIYPFCSRSTVKKILTDNEQRTGTEYFIDIFSGGEGKGAKNTHR